MAELLVASPPAGAVRGRAAVSKRGRRYVRFLGLPYAAPPVGPLRFQPPKPAKRWLGIRNALKYGNPSVQRDLITDNRIGDEDCLYLNVYTPKLPHEKGFAPLPVMFWIHGGGFTAGEGSDAIYGPDLLIEHNVVLVTINYRLGALGFLSTGDSVIPGNMGLKDQVMALRWVQKNIAAFGGDPKNVTIFGESAGGASVHYLLLSPMSNGLFHKAIIQSGAAFCPWAFTDEPRKTAFQLAASLGCQTTDSKELLSFLSKVPAKDILECTGKLFTKEEAKFKFEVVFPPTGENTVAKDCFLPKHPQIMAQSLKYKKEIPLLIGSTNKEGYIFMQGIFEDPTTMKKHFQDTMGILKNKSINQLDLEKRIMKQYFNNKPVSEDILSQYSDLITDVYFGLGVHKAAKLYAETSSAPTYRFVFTYDGGLNTGKVFSNCSHMPGAGHADELAYLFNFGIYEMEIESGSEDDKIVQKMTDLWTNFARTGVPTSRLDSTVSRGWPRFTNEQQQFISIDKDFTLQKAPFKDRMEFWEAIDRHISSKL